MQYFHVTVDIRVVTLNDFADHLKPSSTADWLV